MGGIGWLHLPASAFTKPVRDVSVKVTLAMFLTLKLGWEAPSWAWHDSQPTSACVMGCTSSSHCGTVMVLGPSAIASLTSRLAPSVDAGSLDSGAT